MKLPNVLLASILFTQSEAWSSINSPITRHRFHSTSSKLKSSTSASDFNVVLKPSSDPEAFDSFKIGAARVHRYARDDSGGDSEYVMWYVFLLFIVIFFFD
jgi:hypothetical protein